GRISDVRRELDTSVIGSGVRLEEQRGRDEDEITPEVRSRRVGDRDSQIVGTKGAASVELLDRSLESDGVANAKRGVAADGDGPVTTRQRRRQCNKTGKIDRVHAGGTAHRGKCEHLITRYRDSTDSTGSTMYLIPNANREGVAKSGWPCNSQILEGAVVE